MNILDDHTLRSELDEMFRRRETDITPTFPLPATTKVRVRTRRVATTFARESNVGGRHVRHRPSLTIARAFATTHYPACPDGTQGAPQWSCEAIAGERPTVWAAHSLRVERPFFPLS